MSNSLARPRRRARPSGLHRAAPLRRRKRAVSDVVATIILLAMTVVLFSAVFAFVTSFPTPAAQSANQFQATLFYSGVDVEGVNITHLAGPQVQGGAEVWVKSAHNPTACYSSSPMLVSAGISSSVWSLGQTWHGPFASFPGCPVGTVDGYPGDNLTIYIVSGSTLLFSAVLPGQSFVSPPTILASWTSPSSITTSEAFKIYTTVSGNLAGHKPYINLAGLPGQSGPAVAMWFNSSNSAWQENVTGVTTAGTYYAPINVTGTASLTSASSATVVISSGGSSSSASLSITPSISPSPAFVRYPESLVGTVTNSGSTSVTISSVTFWVNFTSNHTEAIVPKSGTITQSVVSAYSSVVVVSASTWLPFLATTYNLTARVLFTSGATATQWNSQLSIGQPFTITVTPSPARVNASSAASFAIVLSNDGPLAGTTANVSLFIVYTTTNGSHGWSTNGKSPVSNGHGGWWVSNASTTLGAYATLFWTPSLTSPAGGPYSYTITVSVTLTNSASWSTTYTLKAYNSITG